VAISHINLTKEIPTLISFARNDGWDYNTKIYISKKIISHTTKKSRRAALLKKTTPPIGRGGG